MEKSYSLKVNEINTFKGQDRLKKLIYKKKMKKKEKKALTKKEVFDSIYLVDGK